MKAPLILTLFVVVTLSIPVFEERDDECYLDDGELVASSSADLASSTGAAIAASPTGSTTSATLSSSSISSTASASLASASSTFTASNATNSTSGLSMPMRPDGSAGFLINGDHISAPVDNSPVPAGAATYIPGGDTFNCSDFIGWMAQQKTSNSAKFMKVAAGIYSYDLGSPFAPGSDSNLASPFQPNIQIYFMPGGWTLDLRGVTFLISITDDNVNQRPYDMIYINQSEDFTILGGTVWIDQGEQWSQARVTSLSAPGSDGNQIATMTVEEGYNTSVWTTANARNLGCVDDSDTSHYTRPGCNFWYVSNYNFDNLASQRTFTASVASRAGIQQDYVLTIQCGPNSLSTITTENNGNFNVKGFTSNGGTGSIGLSSKAPPTFTDVYFVNPPPRPGFAARVQGPTLSWGNINSADYDAPGQAASTYTDSYWQYTGCSKDLTPSSNGALPSS